MVRLLLVPALLLGACVVKVAPAPPSGQLASLPAEPLPAPVDVASVEERLDLLGLDPMDVDQRDRLAAARQLLRRFRDADPREQRAVVTYLRALLSIEERSRPVDAPALYAQGEAAFVVGGTISEETLGDEQAVQGETVGEDTPGAPAGPAASLDPGPVRSEAQALVDAGDLEQALSVLERCRGQGCWAAVRDAWLPVRDAYVREEREQARAAFRAAREQPDPVVRLGALREIRERLAGVADRYPQSAAAEDVRRNLALVQRSLEAAHSAVRSRAEGGADPGPSSGDAP